MEEFLAHTTEEQLRLKVCFSIWNALYDLHVASAHGSTCYKKALAFDKCNFHQGPSIFGITLDIGSMDSYELALFYVNKT